MSEALSLVLTDEQLFADAISAENEGSVARWRAADDYAELHERGYSTRQIATGVDKSQSHIVFCLSCARDYPGNQRPDFQDAYEEAKGKGRSERDAKLKQEREEAENEAQRLIKELGSAACRIEVADLRAWRPLGVSAIVTDPPYITADAIELHSALADFALEVLPTHGALAVMTSQRILPAVLEAMRRERLVYRWTAAWNFETSERTPERKSRVFDGWKPILVFHKDGWTEETTYLYDTIGSAHADKESHEWGQSLGGFRHLVRAFSAAGETICDPFVGGGTTAVASLAESRLFVGCDVDANAVAATSERLAA